MVFATAKYWGYLPHVVLHFPLRYYRQLRDFYLKTLEQPEQVDTPDPDSKDFDFDAELFRGDSL